MKFIYLDASSGLSGDMILGALLDLGVSPSLFKKEMSKLGLPVEIEVRECKRASIRALKVNITVKDKKKKVRRWQDIKAIIDKSPFTSAVKERALAIFKNLFKAESRVHGRKFQEAHLHEAGANDAIIDIVGCSFLVEILNIGKVYVSPLNTGQGWVKGSHGVLPVPPPAVAELLKDAPVYSAWVKEELVTPTGAAIASTLMQKYISFPEMSYEKIGYGAGRRNFPGFPNVLRIFSGNHRDFKADKKVYMIETNIDDCSPQILASCFDTAFKLGALDVFLTPVYMKKNRLASKLTVLAETNKIDPIITSIFKETSSIGVRYFPVERRVLEREIVKIQVLGEKISVKVSYLDGKEVNIQPEFSDCSKLAKKKQLPVKKIIEQTLIAFSAKRK